MRELSAWSAAPHPATRVIGAAAHRADRKKKALSINPWMGHFAVGFKVGSLSPLDLHASVRKILGPPGGQIEESSRP